MKPKMLFVDDRSKRIHAAISKFSTSYNVIIAPNFFEAMRLMSADDFQVVSLDHDLNGCDFEDPDSRTSGMEIVRYLEKTGWPENKAKPKFWIHSKNLFAAHLMITRLKAIDLEAFRVPFEYEVKNYIKYDEHGNPINLERTGEK